MHIWACSKELRKLLDEPVPGDIGTWAWFIAPDFPRCPFCGESMVVATTDQDEADDILNNDVAAWN
jgi:hypothetical protein